MIGGAIEPRIPGNRRGIARLILEITGKCQIECSHCYADSGPVGNHGAMAYADWVQVIDQAALLGVSMIEFIGGEPTLHPDLARLVDHALRHGLATQVFSNLVHVSDSLWNCFARPGVSLATSYYSDVAAEHNAITMRNSHARTRANIVEAVSRAIPLRVTLIDVHNGQRIGPARAELAALGVRDIKVDRLRQVGRGAGDSPPDATQLCGRCARDVVAVSTDGEVWPCVMARWMSLGNVRQSRLGEVFTGQTMTEVSARLAASFDSSGGARQLVNCGSTGCSP